MPKYSRGRHKSPNQLERQQTRRERVLARLENSNATPELIEHAFDVSLETAKTVHGTSNNRYHTPRKMVYAAFVGARQAVGRELAAGQLQPRPDYRAVVDTEVPATYEEYLAGSYSPPRDLELSGMGAEA